MQSRVRLRSLFCLGLLVVTCMVLVVQASGDDPAAIPVDRETDDLRTYTWQDLNEMSFKERARVVQEMSLVEKEKLRKKWDHFKGLDQVAKEKNRQLYQQVVSHPQGERLHQVMVRYHEWLGGLRSSQRADLLSLEPKKRIERIQQIIKGQEERKFTELLEKELPAEDLRSISQWVDSFITSFSRELSGREAEVIASMDLEQQRRLKAVPDANQRRRIIALGALFVTRSEKDGSAANDLRPSDKDFQQLRVGLSAHGQKLFDQAEGMAEQRTLVRQWARAALMSSRKALPRVSDETLEAFRRDELEFKLKPEDRERLERLSGERLKQQLKWYYYRYRGDLEPEAQNRFGGRSGRSNGGRRGTGRPAGGGRPRSPESDGNRFIDRGFPSPRSP